jgi:hypothetical protein
MLVGKYPKSLCLLCSRRQQYIIPLILVEVEHDKLSKQAHKPSCSAPSESSARRSSHECDNESCHCVEDSKSQETGVVLKQSKSTQQNLYFDVIQPTLPFENNKQSSVQILPHLSVVCDRIS